MTFNFKQVLHFLLFFFVTGSVIGQFQDSILIENKLSTAVSYYEDPSGSYMTFGTSDMVLHKFKLTESGIEKDEVEKFSSQASMQDAIRSVQEKDEISYNDVYIYDEKFSGSGLGGYFAPFKFKSTRRNLNVGEDKAEWDLPLEKTAVDSYEKHLTSTFNFDSTTYSVLVSGHKVKKDKAKKNNEHRDFDVFIYNGEKLKKFHTKIETEWGVIPNSAGVYTDEKGSHLGFYIEFDLGGGADGLSKMNKEAPKNTKYIALLDDRGQYIRTVEAVMPIRMGTTNFGEFYVNNMLLIDDKVHLYVVTREYKFGKGGSWIPGYFTFKEEDGKVKYLENLSYVDFQKNLTRVYSNTNRIDDMSAKFVLDNGNLSSIGSSDGRTFKYMNTKENGDVEVFGTFVFSHSKPENPQFKIINSEAGADWGSLVIYNKFSSSSFAAPFLLENDFIFVSKKTGKIVPICPAQYVTKVEKRVTKNGIISYGLGKVNPKAIHIAFSPNHMEK